MRRALALSVILGLGIGLAACGEDEDPDDVRATIERFVTAVKGQDYQEICDELFAEQLLDAPRNAGLPCEVALRISLEDRRGFAIAVREVETDGDEALVRARTSATGERPADSPIQLVKEDGSWKIAALATTGPEPPEPEGP